MSIPLRPPTGETCAVHLRANFRHLYADVLWFGILSGSTLSFLNIYITRLGGASFHISLLTALPAIINLLFSLPAGRWLGEHRLVRVTFWSAVLTRVGYLALIPLAWFLVDSGQIQVVVVITALMAVPGTLLAISFNALFADVVPAEWRGDVVGRRNALVAVSMTVTNLVCGQLLDRISFPLNYQVVFTIGALGAALSTYHLSRLQGASRTVIAKPVESSPRKNLVSLFRRLTARSASQPLLQGELLSGRNGKFFISFFVFYSFQYASIPLYPLAVVNLLNLTDGQISLGNAMFYGFMMLASLQLGRLSRRFGHHTLLVASGLTFSLYPLLVGLASGPGLYWAASILGGIIWAIISAALLNRLMEVVPQDLRPAYMAIQNITLNSGILIGSMMAPLLSVAIGLQPALLVSAGLRFLAGFLLIFWG